MINTLFIFAVSLFMVIKGATMATKYAASIAECYRISKYAVGFIIIAVISILPETFIAINAALKGQSSFGLGMLFGSNVADLTLIIALVVFFAGRSLKVESKILKHHVVYPFMLVLPLVLGLNGHFSRLEGIGLIIAGCVFYYLSLREGADDTVEVRADVSRVKSLLMLLLSMALLLTGAHFTVSSATALASFAGVSPILIGMLVVGLGTTIPEFFFSFKSMMKKDDSLAVGDILGTVLVDATIVVGILATVRPFFFPQRIIFVTGVFMVLASLMLFYFAKSGRSITKREARLMLFFWIAFVLVEFFANT